MRAIRRRWPATIAREHNRRMEAKGHHFAVIRVPGFRRSLREFIMVTSDEIRERVAVRIAPWLDLDQDQS